MSLHSLCLILLSSPAGSFIYNVRSNFQHVQSCLCLQKAYCGHCGERIWGLGSQGYKCINCKLLVHKRCHRLLPQTCQRLMVSILSCIQAPNDTVTSYYVSEHSSCRQEWRSRPSCCEVKVLGNPVWSALKWVRCLFFVNSSPYRIQSCHHRSPLQMPRVMRWTFHQMTQRTRMVGKHWKAVLFFFLK